MPSGFLANGVDLDQIFEPYGSGAKAAATGFLVAGVDISNRYAPLSQGSSAGLTGLLSAGSDLNTIFAALGTVVGFVDPPGFSGVLFESLASGVSAPTTAFVDFRIQSDGTWKAQVQGGTVIGSGQWLSTAQAGIGAGYEVQFDVVADAGMVVSNGAAAFASVSISRSVTLTVTVNTQIAVTRNAVVTVNLRPVGGTAITPSFSASVTAEIST